MSINIKIEDEFFLFSRTYLSILVEDHQLKQKDPYIRLCRKGTALDLFLYQSELSDFIQAVSSTTSQSGYNNRSNGIDVFNSCLETTPAGISVEITRSGNLAIERSGSTGYVTYNLEIKSHLISRFQDALVKLEIQLQQNTHNK